MKIVEVSRQFIQKETWFYHCIQLLVDEFLQHKFSNNFKAPKLCFPKALLFNKIKLSSIQQLINVFISFLEEWNLFNLVFSTILFSLVQLLPFVADKLSTFFIINFHNFSFYFSGIWSPSNVRSGLILSSLLFPSEYYLFLDFLIQVQYHVQLFIFSVFTEKTGAHV